MRNKYWFARFFAPKVYMSPDGSAGSGTPTADGNGHIRWAPPSPPPRVGGTH